MTLRLWITVTTLLVGCDASFTDLGASTMNFDEVSADTGDSLEVIAQGPFQGVSGYTGAGTATLERTVSGSLRLRFDDDFRASAVPGPIVVLSRRANLNGGLDDDTDIQLATLDRNELSGAQMFGVPEAFSDARVAWIYCAPFGVEVARATMEDLP